MSNPRMMKRTVSANQRRMMSVLSQQNCINLSSPGENMTAKTIDRKMSTVNLMFLEDVLEDIESNAKKMQQDINKNLHNLKSIQYNEDDEDDEEKELESFGSSEENSDTGDDYSDEAVEMDSDDSYNFDFGADDRKKEGRDDGVDDEARKMNTEEKKKKKKKVASQNLNSNQPEDNVNDQPGNSPLKAQSFFVKKKTKACNKAVRLALLEAGPFRQLLKEGVKVIVHFLRKGETRVSRVQRIMIWLEDDDMEQEGEDSNVQDREDYFDVDSSEEEVDFSLDGHEEDKLNLFGFFKLDQNGVLESSTNLSDINEITSVYMGANSSVFRRSLDHLHGKHMSYDRSEHSNRCFSLIGCKSPFDDRPCLDIEILPRDKQKPEEIHAACMIAYGIATSFQVLSNLSNTTVIATKDDVEEEDEHGTFRHRDDTRHSQSFASLFDGGRLPPAKLTVNYLMEEVMDNIPNAAPNKQSGTSRSKPLSKTNKTKLSAGT